MKLTTRQLFLIENLHRLTSRRKMSGRRGYFLEGQECSTTIHSLIVKRVVAFTPDGKGVTLVRRAEDPPRPAH